jgi:hypothetical protein
MELMTDLAKALRPIVKDFIPARETRVDVVGPFEPPYPWCGVKVYSKGQTYKDLEAKLYELGDVIHKVMESTWPSLKFKVLVVGGSEAAGIEVQIERESEPAYGTIHKAKVERLIATEYTKMKGQLK